MDNNWFKISPSKMLALMSSLPTGQMRAHMTLLVIIYLSDGGLPDEDEALAFRSSLPLADIQALRPYFRFLGRCEGGRLYLDFAEDIIMERVEFAEKKANAGAKRWKDAPSAAKQSQPEDSTAKTPTALNSTPKKQKAQLSTAKHSSTQLSTAKHSSTQLSTAKPNRQTDRQTDKITESANALSGAGAPTEPEISSGGGEAQPEDPPERQESQPAGSPDPEEIPQPQESSSGRKPDPLFQEFCGLFQSAHDGEPYAYKPADFVKLAELRGRYAKAKPAPWEVTVERFRQAAGHYFASDLATHTLADLCERFSTFFRNAVDRFNKPIANGNGAMLNGKTQTGKAALNDPAKVIHVRTTEEDGIRTPQRI